MNSLRQTLLKGDPGFPVQKTGGELDIGLSLRLIILRKGFVPACLYFR